MKKSSFVTLMIAVCILFVGFGCSSLGSKPAETNSPSGNPTNSTATNSTPNNSAANNSTTADSSTSRMSPKDISSSYSATGKNSDGGGDYTADLIVTNRDDVYQFSWNSQGKKYDGVGVQTDDKVAVSFPTARTAKAAAWCFTK